MTLFVSPVRSKYDFVNLIAVSFASLPLDVKNTFDIFPGEISTSLFARLIVGSPIDCGGYKFNFTDLQASIGIEQLKKLNKIISRRKKIRKKYDSYLKPLVKSNFIRLFKHKHTTAYAHTYDGPIYTFIVTDNMLLLFINNVFY